MTRQRHYYTDEKNAQIVIALLKAHGIHKVVTEPGTTNIAFVGSVQNDPWFQVYSDVYERHSTYLCGMAAVLRFIEMFEMPIKGWLGCLCGKELLPH